MNHLEHFQEQFRTRVTRRWFFEQCGLGLGSMALGSLLGDLLNPAARAAAAAPARPLAPKAPHFAPKAKRVIYLFQAGAPSHLDLFDPKPNLKEMTGKELPKTVRGDQRITGMTSGQAQL